MNYQTFALTIENHIAQVVFNRPDKANALNQQAWDEMKAIFEELDKNEEVRVIVLSGEGKHFCAGIDLALLMDVSRVQGIKCEGRKREKIRDMVFGLQAPINAIEKCRKPVLTAIHGGCIGGAIDIISACDMRYSVDDAYFTVKEIDMGMVADLGTLQRLPKIIPDGIAREMAYTGRKVSGKEAATFGLVNRSFSDKSVMMEEVMAIAQTIAEKSPLSIRGTKQVMLHSRDHTVADGLEYMATWNAAMLLSEDLMTAFQAAMSKKKPEFKN
ncbi:MAG: crotonase/enoyl-CoA hydratase family protein [Bacteroidetes bacterium]|nr:crotonase/enoyl-CoA hydratase family protein [Bacteroidota bacterium]